jgi:predicted transcriptional regulator of viral defense system
MRIEDRVLRELHRAAIEAGRRGVAVPSTDLDTVAERTGNRAAAQKAIQRLVRAERIVPVQKDLLILPETTGLLGVDMVDLIDAVAPHPYLITGGRALEHHELSDQHFFRIVVLVPRWVRKLSYRGQTAAFMETNSMNIWGWSEGLHPQYALPERAITDALNHPRFGVSLTQAVDALLLGVSRDPHLLDGLLETVIRLGSRSAARRVGLIIERFFGADASAPYRNLIGENRSPVLLRPRGSTHGEVDTTWRVVVNAILEPERTHV